MIKQKIDYTTVKNGIEGLLGERVKVLVNLGRNKTTSFCGVVSACYPALFTVSPDAPFGGKTSFSYSEVTCGAVTVERSVG